MYKVWTGICPILGLLLIHGYVSFTFHLRNTVTLLNKRIIGIQEALYVTQMLHTNYFINPNIIGFSEWAEHLMSKGLSPCERSTLWVKFFSQICYHYTGNPRFDSKGKPCTKIGGIMDYNGPMNRWSTCSVEDLNKLVAKSSPFCLKTNNLVWWIIEWQAINCL